MRRIKYIKNNVKAGIIIGSGVCLTTALMKLMFVTLIVYFVEGHQLWLISLSLYHYFQYLQ